LAFEWNTVFGIKILGGCATSPDTRTKKNIIVGKTQSPVKPSSSNHNCNKLDMLVRELKAHLHSKVA
jgi:hypothetical protein